jgi:hypothetical protein
MKEKPHTLSLPDPTPPAVAEPPKAEPVTPAGPSARAAVTPYPSNFGWSCGLCRYQASMSDGTFQCRHDPPQLISGNVTWPAVSNADWCGEYAPE